MPYNVVSLHSERVNLPSVHWGSQRYTLALKSQFSKKKIVLAYSGGLDTSIILKWLQENFNAEVICYTADIGQEIDKKKIIKNAKNFGVKKKNTIKNEELKEEK